MARLIANVRTDLELPEGQAGKLPGPAEHRGRVGWGARGVERLFRASRWLKEPSTHSRLPRRLASPPGPGLQGDQPGPRLSPAPRSLGLRGDPTVASRGRAGRCPRTQARRPRPRGGGGDAEVPGGRADRQARLREGAARPHRLARAPGRSQAGAPQTGRSRLPRAPLRARGAPAGGGRGTGAGRARGRSQRRLLLAPELGEGGTRGGRVRQGAPRRSGGLQDASYVLISVGCPAPAAFVPKAPGEPGGAGGGVGTAARGASSAASLPSSRHRQGWAAPGLPAWAMGGASPDSPFLCTPIPLPLAPLILSSKRMRFKKVHPPWILRPMARIRAENV